MNKDFWLEQIKKREVFERAYVYAIYYQIKEDAYCNFIEIAYYRQNKEKLFKEIESSLKIPVCMNQKLHFHLSAQIRYVLQEDDIHSIQRLSNQIYFCICLS
jgi:hypothetical protein